MRDLPIVQDFGPNNDGPFHTVRVLMEGSVPKRYNSIFCPECHGTVITDLTQECGTCNGRGIIALRVV